MRKEPNGPPDMPKPPPPPPRPLSPNPQRHEIEHIAKGECRFCAIGGGPYYYPTPTTYLARYILHLEKRIAELEEKG